MIYGWGSDQIMRLIIYFIVCFYVRPELSFGFSLGRAAHGVVARRGILVSFCFGKAGGTSVCLRHTITMGMAVAIRVIFGG